MPAVARADRSFTSEELDARLADGGSFPIVEPGRAPFAFAGPVEAVRLVQFGVGFPDDLGFEPVDDSEWWVLPLEVPDGSRLEYKLETHDSWGQHLVNDPLNPTWRRTPSAPTRCARRTATKRPCRFATPTTFPEARSATSSLWSEAFGRDITVTVYEPASVHDGGAAPLVIVHDGGDYLRYAAMHPRCSTTSSRAP